MQRPFVPRHVLSTFVVGVTVTATSYVYACSRLPESGPAKNLSRFHPQSEAHFQKPSSAVADPIYGIARALNELQATTLTGPILESVLVQGRNVAKKGALPIPPDIRKELTDYSTEDSMNRVRYRIGDVGSLNLAILLERGGYADAVTLIDVVVFRDAIAAATISLWAHELVHVDQFQEWGVHGFAIRYAQNWQAVENSAYAKGDGIAHCSCCQQVPGRPN
ncbi:MULTISPECIES: DUF4157 domain-containing protein [unclassified Rhizobium]|uniref:eCIS core domain-containing protein n=1 Tax=unclassified Rhizobium TaxID=2613769 RepID=UPI000B529DD2|nr:MULTISPECIES: DUF4157 domain-containing protein [unclassified Rhizobium]